MRAAILVAGGGTGGHVYPALAVAQALVALADVDVVFCGTERGIESRVVPAAGFRLELLDVRPIQGGGAGRAARGVAAALLAMGGAWSLVRSLRPRVAFSVGGYAAGPASLAAALAGVPLAILEPNGVAGLANRLLGPFARRAYLASPAEGGAFRPTIRRITGMPLRGDFRPSALRPEGRRPLRVLVLGGSQGASALNERLPDALQRLDRGGKVEIVHQTGRGKAMAVRDAYARRGLEARVLEFVDDMPAELAAADLIVARSGASTVAEIACVGRPAIFVPFPDAADDHQTKNAQVLADAGAAVCIGQAKADAARLAAEIARVLDDGALRARMGDAARACGRPSASIDVASDLLALGRISPRAASPRDAKSSARGQEAR